MNGHYKHIVKNLVACLNGDLTAYFMFAEQPLTADGVQRLRELVDLLLKLDSLWRPLKRDIARALKDEDLTTFNSFVPEALRRANLGEDEIRSMQAEVNERLQRYPLFYRLAEGSPDSSLGLTPSAAGNAGKPVEGAAVSAIVLLDGDNRLHQLAKCNCGRYFFSQRKDQVTCSSKCRQRIYVPSEAARSDRRKYQRDYYRKNYSKGAQS